MSFNTEKWNILVLGGGFAGLSHIIHLRKIAGNNISITLIDKSPYHKKLTHLHHSVFTNNNNWKIPFSTLAKKFNFYFIQANLEFTSKDIEKWTRTKEVLVNKKKIPFDALLIATGSKARNSIKQVDNLTLGYWKLNDLTQSTFPKYFLEKLSSFQIKNTNKNKPPRKIKIAFIGAGATSLQFLFSLYNYLRKQKIKSHFSLWQKEEKILNELSPAFHDYITKSLQQKGIDYHKGYDFQTVQYNSDTSFQVGFLKEGENKYYNADLVFSFTGVQANPFLLKTDSRGRLILENQILDGIYSAGDCSFYEGVGLNSLSAQAALRKGKVCAENILLYLQKKKAKIYNYKELGFVLDMGIGDGIAWLAQKDNTITGVPAFLIKETIEKQYDLYLNGLDTYIPSNLLNMFH